MAERQPVLAPSLELAKIAAYHNDVVSALGLYFSESAPTFATRFGAARPTLHLELLASRLEELDFRSSLMVLTSLEAVFRLDFEARCERRLKDPLSLHFRDLRNSRRRKDAAQGTGKRLRGRFNLDKDILEGWKLHGPSISSALISELRGALKLRNWLAHGRHWMPKLGRKYDFAYLHLMATTVVEGFPFEI